MFGSKNRLKITLIEVDDNLMLDLRKGLSRDAKAAGIQISSPKYGKSAKSLPFPIPFGLCIDPVNAALITVVIRFGVGVAAGVIANWLYDKLKGRAACIQIGDTVVSVDREEMEKALAKSLAPAS